MMVCHHEERRILSSITEDSISTIINTISIINRSSITAEKCYRRMYIYDQRSTSAENSIIFSRTNIRELFSENILIRFYENILMRITMDICYIFVKHEEYHQFRVAFFKISYT